jgi:hypothetical protein
MNHCERGLQVLKLQSQPIKTVQHEDELPHGMDHPRRFITTEVVSR